MACKGINMVNGAVFIDFENIYLSIKKDICVPPYTPRPVDIATALLSGLKKQLREKGVSLVIGRSFSDWDYSDTREALHSLAMMGFEPQYLTAKPNKNSADLVLSLDAMEILLTRDDIEHFVIVGGDRDYIPIVRRIKERAKAVTVVGFRQNTSGDLKEIVGPDGFLDAALLLPQLPQFAPREEARPPMGATGLASIGLPVVPSATAAGGVPIAPCASASETNGSGATAAGVATAAIAPPGTMPSAPGAPAPAAGPAPALPPGGAPSPALPSLPTPPIAPAAPTPAGAPGDAPRLVGPDPTLRPATDTTFYRRAHMTIENLERCVELLVRAQETHRNDLIWLAPFFRNYMNEAFFQYSNEQRKELIATLQQMGAISIRTMEGDSGFTYSVVELRTDHPMVAKKMTSRSFRAVTRYDLRPDLRAAAEGARPVETARAIEAARPAEPAVSAPPTNGDVGVGAPAAALVPPAAAMAAAPAPTPPAPAVAVPLSAPVAAPAPTAAIPAPIPPVPSVAQAALAPEVSAAAAPGSAPRPNATPPPGS